MKKEITSKHESIIEDSFLPTKDGKCSEAGKGMVVTAFPEATQAGLEMLKMGGNAVDAACASALALGVCEPQGSGIGGQSVAIIHIDGRTVAIDGSSKAPSLAHSSRFSNESDRKMGYKATTTPSTLAVLGYLNNRYGRLSWSNIVQPAIHIASSGYQITELQSSLLKRELKDFLNVPYCSGARHFLKDGKVPYEAGDKFVQADLAETLSKIAKHGINVFYSGEIAERIDADMKKNDGFLRLEDLVLIPEVIEREPVEGTYRGFSIKSLPPPGSGETLLLILVMMECLPQEILLNDTPEKYQWLAKILYHAFIEYRQHPRNPNTFHQIAGRDKLIRQRAVQLMSEIRNGDGHAGPADTAKQGMGETTHLSVMDADGNAVGLTQSLNLVYGSKIATGGLGFLYNNYIEAFQYGHPEHYYNLRPNGIPWPCATPTIVFRKTKPWLVFGSPGSQRIFSSMSQFLSSIIDQQMSIDKAMMVPRIHSEQNGELSLEDGHFDSRVTGSLEGMGFHIKQRGSYSFYMGAIHAALMRTTGNGFQGVADIRRDGTAKGI